MIVPVGNNSAENVTRTLAGMRETGELCDFTIAMGTAEIKAHKCVLAASCEYFRTSFRFSSLSLEKSHIDMSHLECCPTVVEKVVHSFYTGEIDLDPGCADSVLLLADYLMCGDLQHSVEVFMESSLTYHNAVHYYQTALHYNLNATNLLRSARSLLWFRFHDFFIYQQDSAEAGVDVLQAMQKHGLFHFCTPLQVAEFIVKNLRAHSSQWARSGKQVSLEGMEDHAKQAFDVFKSFFVNSEGIPHKTWRPVLLAFLSEVDFSDAVTGEHLTALQGQVQDASDFVSSHWLDSETLPQTDDHSALKACTEFNDPYAESVYREIGNFDDFLSKTSGTERTAVGCDKNLNTNSTSDISSNTQGVSSSDSGINKEDSLTDRNVCSKLAQNSTQKSSLTDSSKNCRQVHNLPSEPACQSSDIGENCLGQMPKHGHTSQTSDVVEMGPNLDLTQQSQVLVLLAPTPEMASQVNAVDACNVWPLVDDPELTLAFYDLEQRTWRCANKFGFPLKGAMQEKHAWRMAFHLGSVFLISVVQSACLEYNISSGKWTQLSCAQLFAKHSDDSPVKSVIPVSVGSQLVFLSMSRELQADSTFLTQQDFYALDMPSRVFRRVARVRDARMDLPITQWTVHGDLLITVKASSMMYRHLSRIQYIHVLDARTFQLSTYNAPCAMEAGVKVMARGDNLYLLDKEGWCRTYSFKTSEWVGLHRHSTPRQTGFVNPYCTESIYPALTRVTCHAGSSRWEISTAPTTAPYLYLQETQVGEDGCLASKQHPPPPFQYVTAMCPANMPTSELRGLPQARFESSEDKNL